VRDRRITIHDADPLDTSYVLVDGDYPFDPAVWIDTGDGWTDDAAEIAATLPPILRDTYNDPRELQLLDAAGEPIWTVENFGGFGREGFHSAVADSVALATDCADGVSEECSLLAFDIDTGRRLWSLPGYRSVPVVVGDRAIISDNQSEVAAAHGYVLIDLRTGEPVDESSAWPVASFAVECCGGGDYVYVHRDGGVVFAVDGDHVRVWFPPELTDSTTQVDVVGS
jgi:hypothetical protein